MKDNQNWNSGFDGEEPSHLARALGMHHVGVKGLLRAFAHVQCGQPLSLLAPEVMCNPFAFWPTSLSLINVKHRGLDWGNWPRPVHTYILISQTLF